MGSTYRICVCFTRRFRITEPEPPPDVKEAFRNYSEGGAHMTAENLRRFLAEVQGEAGATIADAERIVEQVHHKRHHIAKFTRHTLTLDDFHQYLYSVDLNSPIGSQVSPIWKYVSVRFLFSERNVKFELICLGNLNVS